METIRPEQLKAIDAPSNNEVPSYDSATEQFEWVVAGVGSAHIIQDEATPLTSRTNLNFVGSGVTATDDAGNDTTVVTIPGGVANHTLLSNLDYASANHTGFEPTVTKGNLTATTPVVIDQTRQVIGGAAVISIPKATTTISGYLSSEDWNIFNNKSDAGVTALADLTDVDTTGVTDGQALVYDTDTSMWVPVTVSGITTLSGEGIANQIAYWASSDGLTGDTGLTYDPTTDALVSLGTIAVKPVATAGIKLDPNAATGNFTLSISPANLTGDRRFTLPNANLAITGGGTLGLGGFNLTVSATGSVAFLNVANTFTQTNTFKRSVNATAAMSVQDQDGQNVLGVDTINSRVVVGNGRNFPTYTLDVTYDTAEYWPSSAIPVARFARNCGDYPSVGFGLSTLYMLGTYTYDDQTVARVDYFWANAIDATRKARGVFYIYDTTEREAFRIEATGSGVMIGLFGHAAAVQPTKAGHNNWANISDIATALAELGLIDTA